MSFRSLPLVGACFIAFQVATAQNTVSLAITAQPTSGASGIISPSFAGFGIESSNLFSFTGGSKQNELTQNLLANLANYTGTPPHLRIGGNTQDYFVYNASQDDYACEKNPHSVGQGVYASDSRVIGPRFFEVINRFPSNTPITFGLNLAYEEDDYIDQITTMASQAVERLNDVNLVSFEIGNEPDLYLQNGFRTGSWGGQAYTQQWLDRASAVWQQVLKPKGLPSNFFEPGATASTIGTTFQIQDLDSSGITVKANGSSNSYVASWNQHDYYYYVGVSTYPLTQYHFMTLSTTNDQFAAWEEQITQAENTGYPYALREMGVVGPIGMEDMTDVFGAALWSLNFLFYAASLNISSVQMHMTDNSNASAWQPIEYYGNQPFVRPNYYAFAAFDQTIGPTCQAQVGGYVLHNMSDPYGGRIAAYSVYQDSKLSSVVLINANPVNVSESDKPSLTFELTLPTEFAGKDLYLAYLTNDGADAKHGTTWNGISYEKSGDGTPTRVNDTVEAITIGHGGLVNVTVRDSQAVIANIGTPVGQQDPNHSACQALASKTPDSKPVSTPVGTSTANSASSTHTNAATRTVSSAKSSNTNGVSSLPAMFLGSLISATLTGIYVLLL
ncbi:hypothetical protein ABEF95_015475 [Exophiala dermatitidis]